MPSTESTSGGIGFLGLLAILFIGLKLTGHIAWSWLWVLAPLWGPLGVVAFLLVVAVICFATAGVVSGIAYIAEHVRDFTRRVTSRRWRRSDGK